MVHITWVSCIVSALAWGSVAKKQSEITALLLTRGASTGAVYSWGSVLYRCRHGTEQYDGGAVI
jgi:hypothetical protein